MSLLIRNLTFGYKKPDRDPLIKDIECLKGIGIWVESTVEVKIKQKKVKSSSHKKNVAKTILIVELLVILIPCASAV